MFGEGLLVQGNLMARKEIVCVGRHLLCAGPLAGQSHVCDLFDHRGPLSEEDVIFPLL